MQDPLPKPESLVELALSLTSLFAVVKRSFGIANTRKFKLRSVDCAHSSLQNFPEIAAFTLRKIQLLHYVAQPGVRTTNCVVVNLAADLNLSLTELAQNARSRKDDREAHEMIECRNKIVKVSDDVISMDRSGAVVTMI